MVSHALAWVSTDEAVPMAVTSKLELEEVFAVLYATFTLSKFFTMARPRGSVFVPSTFCGSRSHSQKL